MISNLRILSVRTPSKQGTVLLPTRGTMLLISRACLATALLVMMAALDQSVHAEDGGHTRFQRISTQFIAALGTPGATSGSGAQLWGLWALDPGPRGVRLSSFKQLEEGGGVAPARWKIPKIPHRLVAGGTRPHNGAAEHSDPSWQIPGYG